MHEIIEKTTKRNIKNIIIIKVFIYNNTMFCNSIDVLYKLTIDSKYRIDSFARRLFELFFSESYLNF